MTWPERLFWTQFFISCPLLAAWAKIRLWNWQNQRDAD